MWAVQLVQNTVSQKAVHLVDLMVDLMAEWLADYLVERKAKTKAVKLVDCSVDHLVVL